jgi:hypothetical protein
MAIVFAAGSESAAPQAPQVAASAATGVPHWGQGVRETSSTWGGGGAPQC